MATFAFTLLPFVPLAAWALLVGWSPASTEGEALLTVPVPILARLKMLSVSFILGLVVLVMGIAMGHVHWWMAGPMAFLYIGVLAVPTNYLLTTSGIRTGRGVFRRWTEFADVRRSPFGAMLVGSQRASNYPIYLSGGREDDEFVLTLKNLVRDSYQGRATERDRIRERRARDHSGGVTSNTSSISH